MIKINGKYHRNIQEQVAKNTSDIAAIKNAGIIGYEAGDGIDIDEGVISVDTDVIQEKIEANPTAASTATLNKLEIDDVVYALGGSGEPAAYIKQAVVNTAGDKLTLTKKDDSTVVFNPSIAAGTVTSVNEKTGAVVLTAEDVGVEGENDGTNWTSLTIDDETYAIPSGGSGSGISGVWLNGSNVPITNNKAMIGIFKNGSILPQVGGDVNMVVPTVSDEWSTAANVKNAKSITDGTQPYNLTVVSGHSGDGVNWLTLTIDGVTRNIPVGGSGGVTDYDQLTSRPSIAAVTLTGDKRIDELVTCTNGIQVSQNTISHTNAVTAASKGLYKVAYDAQGHITDSTAVVKSDITGLGIPGQDTNTITLVHNDDNTMNVADQGTGDYNYDISVKYKSNAGLAVDGSNGLYVNSVNGLKFQVVQTEPGEPAANTIYFIFQQ